MAFSHLLYATFAVVAGAVPNVVSTAAGFATLQTRADVTCDGSLAADGLLMGGLSFTCVTACCVTKKASSNLACNGCELGACLSACCQSSGLRGRG